MRRLTVCLLATSFLHAENWPQYRGIAASGLGDGTPPLRWNTETGENIRWKTPIPGLGYSSPVVWGDRLFLTTAVPAKGDAEVKLGLYGDIKPVKNEGAQSFQVLCLDRRTGKILWQQTAVQTTPKIKRHPKSSHANPTPATDGQRLIVSFGSEGLYAYSLDGKLLWKKDLGVLDSGYYVAPDAQWGFASSPILHEDKVIIQADVQKNSFLAAFDAKTGKELWRTPRQDVPTFGTPAVLPNGEGGLQVVVNGWKHMGGYDLATGKERWRLAGTGDIPVPTPVFANGLIVLTAAHGGGRPIYAIRPDAKGDLSQNKAAIAWSQDRSGNYMQTPLLADGIGYFCLDNGVMTVFELTSGERLYQQRLGTASGFTSSPVAAAGRLYITNEDGHTFVLQQGKEYKVLAENELGEPVMATPAVVDGTLYLRGGRHLFAIGQ
ncbi:MAG: PQQ-binding-like beta-propeller repeat protein [Acidobacteriota bacterium]|jgi:outer membrane protein assembly factor BamB|nr:PQQ-binding-like beta-propeller repeat protein [Acidobacteriaceae bacterium]